MADTVRRPAVVVVAEDDDDEFLLTKEAFLGAGVSNTLIRVKDGQELVDLLLRRFSNGYAAAQAPTLVLLDLNMPRKDGRQALQEIRSNDALRRIPIIALTTSNAEDDVLQTYELGVNSFIRKPIRLDDFVEVIRALKRFWLEVVELPPVQHR